MVTSNPPIADIKAARLLLIQFINPEYCFVLNFESVPPYAGSVGFGNVGTCTGSGKGPGGGKFGSERLVRFEAFVL